MKNSTSHEKMINENKKKANYKLYSKILFWIRYSAGIILIGMVTYFFYQKNEFLLFYQVPSITYMLVTIGIFVIFIGVEILKYIDPWEKHQTKELLTRYHTGIITILGFVIGGFFMLVNILWTRGGDIEKLRFHTIIGIGFIIYVLISGYDVINLIQKRIKVLEDERYEKEKNYEKKELLEVINGY